MSLLEGKSIQKSYGQLTVLKGVDIHVDKGEVVSIVGSSGAGKSTLLHVLGTLDRADKGSLMLSGQQIEKLSSQNLAQFRSKHIGFIFQFHNLLPEFSALENVCIPGFISGLEEKKVWDRGKVLMSKLGLTERMNHKPSELSGGEQQRAAVARALINNPEIIFADEPSGNLDSKNARELHNLFFDLRDEFEQTFVIVTHNEQLADMADRKLTIQDGIINKG